MERRTNPIPERAALLFLAAATHLSYGQGLNNLWTGGYASWAGAPYGGVDIDFMSGAAEISYVSREMDFGRTASNITDSAGAPLFATNGYYIANAAGDTMVNGTGLNPSTYTAQFPDGLHISQADLILPQPGSPNIYLLFHGTIDDQVTLTASYLYLTTIDMSLDGGQGAVVTKNQVLIEDELNAGRITAVKHANGRDWWVICHKANSATYYRMLVTPQGVSVPDTQTIGVIRPPDHGQACFSPDGSRFAWYWGAEDLDIFSFDRCAGVFSDPVHIDINDYDQMGGVAFSPSSRFLYVSSVMDVYQFDLSASDIAGSMVPIAHWDSTYSPGPPFATLFDIAQLAPDGRIYIATGNSTDKLHVIEHPDQPGLACGMVQHGVSLPAYFADSCPNHPNYHLGPLAGSACDTLGLGIAEQPALFILGAYPNPSSGTFMLSYAAQASPGTLVVLDMAGKAVLQETIPPWSTVHRVELAGNVTGLYTCRMSWGQRSALLRVAMER